MSIVIIPMRIRSVVFMRINRLSGIVRDFRSTHNIRSAAEIKVDQTVSDREYRLQVSGNLEVWNDLMTFKGNGQAMTLSDANAHAHSMRFYRISSP